MTKYSEIEIQTAQNLLEHGYKWIARYESGRLFAHCDKPFKVNNIWGSFGDSVCVCKFVPIFQSVRFGDKEPTSLEAIVHPQILDDAEKRYLKGVIRPFRKSVRYIEKKFVDDGCEYACCYLLIQFADARERMAFPTFFEKDMYKGMETYKKYTPKELGL